MTTHERATPAINDLVTEVLTAYHPDLVDAELTVATTVVRKFEGEDDDVPVPALKHHGAQANAVIRKLTPRRRILVDHDVELELDGLVWDNLARGERVALLDHELTHVMLLADKKTGQPLRDDANYLKIKLRPDDVTFTGFFAVIERHGAAAMEAQSFARLYPLYLSAVASATQRGAKTAAAAITRAA